MKNLKIIIFLIFVAGISSSQEKQQTRNIFLDVNERYNLDFYQFELKNQLNLFNSNFSQSLYESTLDFKAQYSAKKTSEMFGNYYKTNIASQNTTFLKVMGMISTSAAVGLAGYHLYKYSDKYGLKKKRK